MQRGERAPAVAPAAPVAHGTVLAEGKPGKSGPKSSVTKSRVPSVRPRGCSSGAAPVIGERRREKGENEGLIQNTPQHLEKWATSKRFYKRSGPKMEVVSSGCESEEPPALLSPQTSAKATKLIKLSH